MKILKIALFFAIAAAGLFLLLPSHGPLKPVHAEVRASEGAAPLAAGAGVVRSVASSSSGSPFGSVAENKIDTVTLIQERKERMKKSGYFTPEEYFPMPLTQLKARAKSGDMYARLQLGQKYYFESNSLAFEEGFDFEANPAELGKKYFSDAAVAGHVLITSVLIKLYEQEGDTLNAYAWQLFAKQTGANYRTELDVSKLSAADLEKAKLLAAQLHSRAMQPLALTTDVNVRP